MKTLVTKEITELHDFFTAWFNGSIENTDAKFLRFQKALSPSFYLIDPSGKKHHYADLLPAIKNIHGTKSGFQITIKNVTLGIHEKGFVLATYEEWQAYQGETTVRLSSVLFKENPDMPNNLAWLHLHESWMRV